MTNKGLFTFWMFVACVAFMLGMGYLWWYAQSDGVQLACFAGTFIGFVGSIILGICTYELIPDEQPEPEEDEDAYMRGRREASDYLDSLHVRERVAKAYDEDKVATLACLSDVAAEIWSETRNIKDVDGPTGAQGCCGGPEGVRVGQ